MTWVRRNAQGQIEAASDAAQAGYVEEVDANDPELRSFVTNTPLPEPVGSYDALAARRVRALTRKDTVEARVKAINIKMGD